jgi:hypothetical protein
VPFVPLAFLPPYGSLGKNFRALSR